MLYSFAALTWFISLRLSLFFHFSPYCCCCSVYVAAAAVDKCGGGVGILLHAVEGWLAGRQDTHPHSSPGVLLYHSLLRLDGRHSYRTFDGT